MRGYIRKRGKTSWEIEVYLNTKGGDGKPERVFKTVRGTRRDAESVLAEMLVQVNNNTLIKANKKLTVGEYLEQWLNDYGKSHLKCTTYANYKGVIDGHLIPELGSIPLCKLQPSDVQKYYTNALNSGRKDGKGGLSRRYVHGNVKVCGTGRLSNI
ncbi:MAG TPA: N-terminal phage integrase SAM-like domain-containing protein [Spirochaetia bacterium]|nr:N-terminal phage integrase SAM-like domain-containing protein [Spirochaetia bacterium]